jgi:tripartite ATP-independent transporter DctP family solute receptor
MGSWIILIFLEIPSKMTFNTRAMKNDKYQKPLLISMVCVTFLAGCSDSPDPSQDKVVIKIAYGNQPGEPTDLGVKEWARLAADMSGGRIELQPYPASQLGSQQDVAEQVRLGAAIISISDGGFLMDYVEDVGITYAPFLTRSYEAYFRLMDSPWFASITDRLRDRGFEVVTAKWVYGTRHLLTTKPVKTPADMKGLKIRTPAAPTLIKTITYMGGVPTPMPLSEVYPALTQGVIDGAENPLPVLTGAKLHEAGKYLCLTGHLHNVSIWVGSSKVFADLPPDLVRIIKEAAEVAARYTFDKVNENDEKALAEMRATGVEINAPDVEAFRAAVRPIYTEMFRSGLYDEVMRHIGSDAPK